jgi:thymidylate synthase
MIKADEYYLANLQDIVNYGCWDENPRPTYADGTPAHSKFISQVFEKYEIENGEFPITTLRNTAIKTGIKEILWIYQKQSNSLDVAHELGINWWDEWNIGDDTIGQRYGATVFKYDMVNNLLNGLKKDPFGRRHIMDLYQFSDFSQTIGLNPCAFLSIWTIRKINSEFILDLTLIQRSNDYIMSGYINKIQYVALQMMIAGHLNYKVGKFCHFTQNCHIYDRHFDAVNEIMTRTPLDVQPMIKLKSNKNFYEYTVDDFEIIGIEGIQKLSTKLEIAI